MAGRWRSVTDQMVGNGICQLLIMRRLITTKASNKAAVHGTKPPVTETINKEEAEKEINRGKEEKENKREEVEKIVDSQFNRSDKPYPTIK